MFPAAVAVAEHTGAVGVLREYIIALPAGQDYLPAIAVKRRDPSARVIADNHFTAIGSHQHLAVAGMHVNEYGSSARLGTER